MTFNRYYEICRYVTDGADAETISNLKGEDKRIYDELKRAKDKADKEGREIYFDAPFELFDEAKYDDSIYSESVDDVLK